MYFQGSWASGSFGTSVEASMCVCASWWLAAVLSRIMELEKGCFHQLVGLGGFPY